VSNLRELLQAELAELTPIMETHLREGGWPIDLKLVITKSVEDQLTLYTFSSELLSRVDGTYQLEERRLVIEEFDESNRLIDRHGWDLTPKEGA